jgi:hypothetical protein
MLTDSCTTRSTPAASAASTTAAEPSRRIRSLASHARARVNRVIDGIAEARLTTASCPANTSASADRSNSDTDTGSAPCRARPAALSGVRASAVTAWPSAISAGIAWLPIAPVPPVTKTFM